MLSPTERTEMFRQVRVVLVRHFIDIGRLTINLGGTAVRLRGSLCRLPGVEARLTPDVVTAMIGEIGRVPGVRRVEADFDNWRQLDGFGEWQPVEISVSKKCSSSAAGVSSPTFNLDRPKPAPDTPAPDAPLS